MGEKTDFRIRQALNNGNPTLKLIALVLGVLVSGVALGLWPSISELQTRAMASEQHSRIQEQVDTNTDELKLQREQIYETQIKILEELRK